MVWLCSVVLMACGTLCWPRNTRAAAVSLPLCRRGASGGAWGPLLRGAFRRACAVWWSRGACVVVRVRVRVCALHLVLLLSCARGVGGGGRRGVVRLRRGARG